VTQVLVATRNQGKLAEFRQLLAVPELVVVGPDDLGLAPDVAEDALEAFETFEANARAKAEWFAARSGLPVLADDSGLEVDALGGAPGVWSKRLAGLDGPDHAVTAANNAELLRRLDGIPAPGRGAGYRCVLVLRWPDGRELVAHGVTRGQVLEAPQGAGGFGYDPLFRSDELRMTFAEASAAAKHRVSHRGRAVTVLRSVWPWG
jgi:XTP/dITP diphosphohydrolase